MKKNYETWTPIKTKINNCNLRPMGYKERDIWHASIGENIGFEQDGKGKRFDRPVLILRGFNKKICSIIPLSTTEKRGKFYYAFDGKTGKISVSLLSQIKIIDTSRLRHKIGTINKEDFLRIKKEIINLYNL